VILQNPIDEQGNKCWESLEVLRVFVRIFYKDSEAINLCISVHCPGGQTFLSEKHLKEFANRVDLVKMI